MLGPSCLRSSGVVNRPGALSLPGSCTMNRQETFMATSPTEEKPTPKTIAAYVKSNAARARKAQQMQHGESVVTREADYKGHHITVRTKYEVEVDGKPLMGHMGVTDAGSVHYHAI